MRGHWFEEYERLWNEADEGMEPDPAAVDEAVAERLAVQIDRARDAAKYGEF